MKIFKKVIVALSFSLIFSNSVLAEMILQEQIIHDCYNYMYGAYLVLEEKLDSNFTLGKDELSKFKSETFNFLKEDVTVQEMKQILIGMDDAFGIEDSSVKEYSQKTHNLGSQQILANLTYGCVKNINDSLKNQ